MAPVAKPHISMIKEKTELATPALSGLLDFWLGKCSGGNPPVSSDIAPAELRPWKDNIVIFEVVGEDDFVYSYYGKALAESWGHSRLGHTLDALPAEQHAVLRAEYDTARRERLPLARVYTGEFDGSSRTFERLVLPLCGDGRTVDKLLVAAYEVTPKVEEPPAAEPEPVPESPAESVAEPAAEPPTEAVAEEPSAEEPLAEEASADDKPKSDNSPSEPDTPA